MLCFNYTFTFHLIFYDLKNFTISEKSYKIEEKI